MHRILHMVLPHSQRFSSDGYMTIMIVKMHNVRVAVFLFYVSHLHGTIKQGRSVEIKFKKFKIKKCILMYNQGNMRLHVDLFIKYVLNNGQFYIDITNNWQRKLLIKLKSLYSLLFCY